MPNKVYKVYRTIQGDTWDMIAKKVYNDEFKLGILMESNPNLMFTFIFSGGTNIICPELKEKEFDKLPNWRK